MALGPVVPAPSCLVRPASGRDPRVPARRGPRTQPAPGRIGRLLTARRLILGLLGPVAAGKSFIARRIAELGPGEVLDADRCAHEALEAAARDGRLAAALGPEALRPDGAPDRDGLRARALADPRVRETLEGLTHPAVKARILEAVARHRRGQGPAVLVLDVPLLVEAGLDGLCDEVWLVETQEGLRRARARERGLDDADLARWERVQATQTVRRGRAQRVIRNDVSPEALDSQIRAGLAAPTAA